MDNKQPEFDWDADEIRHVAEVLIVTNPAPWARLGHGDVDELESYIKKKIVSNYEKYRVKYWGTGGFYVTYSEGQHGNTVVLVTLMPFLIHGYLKTKGLLAGAARQHEVKK